MTLTAPTTQDSTAAPTPVAVAEGDGIGPEIMSATLSILDAAAARLERHPIEIGQKVYQRGITSGIEPDAWQTLRDTRVFLKAPITTPQGGGYKSLNVTTRKTLGLFANVRPCVAYHPFVRTAHPGMDVVIIRDNEEDTYAGIEHQQTREVTQCLKLITRPGCERIVRYAFDFAERNGRRKITCMTKDNIHKLTDGLFHQVFDEVAGQYPQIETEHWIIDIGAARLADTPDLFDVVVTPNLYGDIVSDIAAQVTGSIGLGGSANIGQHCAMFEAIHGSAPPIAGKDVANPSGLLLAAVMMLVHIDQADVAQRVHNAWLRTIEDGVHTEDIYRTNKSTQLVGTAAFADAVIQRLGAEPRTLKPVHYQSAHHHDQPDASAGTRPAKQLVGVDVFIDWDDADRSPEALGTRLEKLAGPGMKLKMITNRGVKVYPGGFPETFCTDHWRCRFVSAAGPTQPITHADVIGLLQRISQLGLDFIKTEHLCTFDGRIGYSLGQGE